MAYEYEEEVSCVDESPKALKIKTKGGKTFWVPKSTVDDDSEVYKNGTDGKLVVADWFAEKEGWS